MKAITVALLLFAVSAPAQAAEHHFRMLNNLTDTITSFKVLGGEVSSFEKTGPGKVVDIMVDLPDGRCEAGVRLRFASRKIWEGKALICSGEEMILTLTRGPRNPQIVFRRQTGI